MATTTIEMTDLINSVNNNLKAVQFVLEHVNKNLKVITSSDENKTSDQLVKDYVKAILEGNEGEAKDVIKEMIVYVNKKAKEKG